MSKNLTRKGLALVSGSTLVLTSLVGVAAPATAAGEVTLTPASGSTYGAFATDGFSVTSRVQTQVINGSTLAFLVENPDQNQLRLTLSGTGTAAPKLEGITEAGAKVTINSDNAIGGTDFIVDFATLDIVALSVHTLGINGGTQNTATLKVQLDESTTGTDTDGTITANSLEYGDLTVATSVDVTAWVEISTTPNYRTVDTAYASDKRTIDFVDPSSVSVISRVERFASASVNNRISTATQTVRAAATGNVTVADVDAGYTLDGVVLAAGDKVILLSGTATENGTYTVNADGVAPTAVSVNVAAADLILVLEGTVNRGARFTGDGTNAISASNGSAATLSSLNAGNDNSLGASLDFSNQGINLAQVDLAKWELSVVSSSTDDIAYGSGAIAQVATPAGYTSVDALGRLFMQVPVADLDLNDGETYSLKFRHSGDTVAPILEFTSPGYQVVTAPAGSTATQIKAAPTTSTDASLGTTYSSGYSVAVRNGVGTVTYKSQIMAAGANVETANVPVIAIVTAGANLPTGATLTVSGATETIKAASATMLVSGLTDSKGNWSVSVTSSDTSSAGAAYTIQFYVLDEATPDAWVTSDSVNSAIYKADYASGSLAATGGFTADATVLSGDNPTVTFSVKDQFGQPLSATSTGRAYSVELKAPSKTNLEQFVAVSGGKATVTFKNYLKAGESDILTAKLYTGTSTSPSYVSGAIVYITLYNTNAVAGVNVPAEVTSVTVTYDDFITGASSATNVAPTDGADTGTGEDFLYTGTVVDANGAGVPGAPVTISGKGFQFVKDGTTTYYVDSITLAANEAGTFSVRGWTTVASATGNVITVTSAGKTATTKVKSAIPSGNASVSVDNLKFTWDLPSTLVMNTTYAVTATLTDKWGNPLPGASLGFNGYAAAQFNGVSTEVVKTTDKNGSAVVYLRSLKDTDGLAAVGVTFKSYDLNADNTSDLTTAVGAVRTDNAATKWDESKWTNTLEAQVNFLKSGSGASGTGKVNVGSFNGKLVVYASGLNGATISWKVGGKWGKAVASSNYAVFNRPTPVAGATVSVDIYVNGVKTLTKSVVTR